MPTESIKIQLTGWVIPVFHFHPSIHLLVSINRSINQSLHTHSFTAGIEISARYRTQPNPTNTIQCMIDITGTSENRAVTIYQPPRSLSLFFQNTKTALKGGLRNDLPFFPLAPSGLTLGKKKLIMMCNDSRII